MRASLNARHRARPTVPSARAIGPRRTAPSTRVSTSTWTPPVSDAHTFRPSSVSIPIPLTSERRRNARGVRVRVTLRVAGRVGVRARARAKLWNDESGRWRFRTHLNKGGGLFLNHDSTCV